MTKYDCRVPKSFIVVQIRVLIFEINAKKNILTFSYVAIQPFENNLLEIALSFWTCQPAFFQFNTGA